MPGRIAEWPGSENIGLHRPFSRGIDPLILSFGSGILLRSNGYMAQASLSTAGLTFSL